MISLIGLAWLGPRGGVLGGGVPCGSGGPSPLPGPLGLSEPELPLLPFSSALLALLDWLLCSIHK